MIRLSPICLAVALAACGSAEPASFAGYDEAAAWYRSNASGETMMPESEAIASAIYFARSPRHVLLVSFTSNTAKYYIHEGVPESVWATWKSSESKGRFFNANIRGRYRFRLVNPGHPSVGRVVE
jgi:hypothetical protein